MKLALKKVKFDGSVSTFAGENTGTSLLQNLEPGDNYRFGKANLARAGKNVCLFVTPNGSKEQYILTLSRSISLSVRSEIAKGAKLNILYASLLNLPVYKFEDGHFTVGRDGDALPGFEITATTKETVASYEELIAL
jgi:hypothetical protein